MSISPTAILNMLDPESYAPPERTERRLTEADVNNVIGQSITKSFPDAREPYLRCQIGYAVSQDLNIRPSKVMPDGCVVKNVQFFHLVAFGSNWNRALAMWREITATEPAPVSA